MILDITKNAKNVSDLVIAIGSCYVDASYYQMVVLRLGVDFNNQINSPS